MSQSAKFPWRTLLFASLAVNLLVIGAVAGAVGAGVRLQREAPGAVVDRMPGPRAFIAALPPQSRAKVRSELARSWEETRALRAAARQARRDAFAAAAAEPYDPERVRAAFARLRDADQAAIGVFHDNVIEAFGALTADERREALEALRSAAPASRRTPTPDAEPDGAQAPGAEPAIEGQNLRERREARRERRRERLQQQTTP